MNIPQNREPAVFWVRNPVQFPELSFLANEIRDMVLLSRIRLAQGIHEDALRLASRVLSFRKECLGERLKVCDSLYQVAVLLSLSGNKALAM